MKIFDKFARFKSTAAEIKILIVFLFLMALAFFVNVCNLQRNGSPEQFTYNKHDYLYFRDKGVVHDPDCRHCFIVFD